MGFFIIAKLNWHQSCLYVSYTTRYMRQITISLALLRDMIWGFDNLCEISAQSVTNAGPETYFPVIIPKDLGKIIEDLNTDGLFTVFHFDHHSEIWHSKHWNDSTSRRWQLVNKSNAATLEFTERQKETAARLSKLHAIKQVILKEMPAFADKHMAQSLDSMAVTLSRSPREFAEKIPGLVEILYPSN